MEIAGYIIAVLIGISLGLVGGGGSILTVPALVYLMGTPALIATTYSLFIVGITSLIGAYTYIKRGLINYYAAIIFAFPSFLSVIFARRILLPLIPNQINITSQFLISKDSLLLILFSVIMIIASLYMIKNQKYNDEKNNDINSLKNRIKIGLLGLVVGILSGLVGAGGGFIIIPALVLFANLKMKMAIGSSLLLISCNSLIGFTSSINSQLIDWNFLLLFTTLSVIGIIIGSYLTNFIEGEKLKKGFGVFIFIMGLFIFIKEIF